MSTDSDEKKNGKEKQAKIFWKKNILNLVLTQDNARPDTAQQNERDHQD
jgi:hypothetical protein